MGGARPAERSLSDRRLFAPELGTPAAELVLTAESARHAHVLRLGEGDEVELFDGRGRSCAARIVSLSRSSLRCAPVGEVRFEERGPEVVLVQCVPKGGKLDEIVRMTTELGVSEIRLSISTRCVSRADEERSVSKVERLSRIAIEAARQSEQAYVPEIVPAQPLSAVLARAPAGALKLACVERSDREWPDISGAGPVWVVVGPEGGMDAQDLVYLEAAGFVSVGLGRSILRTETAAVVGVALVLDRFLDRLRQRR